MNKIDFQGLLSVLTAAENEPKLDMWMWKTIGRCGTTHCMIGAFCDQNRTDKLHIPADDNYPVLKGVPTAYQGEAIALRFGITVREAGWLFTAINNDFAEKWTSAQRLSKKRALARLRKFIYYKLHKQELIVETGRNHRVINQGRNISGNRAAALAANA